MGCAVKNPVINRQASVAESLQLSSCASNNTVQVSARRRQSQRIISLHNHETDFWNMIPFYVLNNRIRLLSFEVSDKSVLLSIHVSLVEIFNKLILNSGGITYQRIQAKSHKWIHKFANGFKVIRALGLKIERNNIVAMDGLTTENLKNKLKELNYAFSLIVEKPLIESADLKY